MGLLNIQGVIIMPMVNGKKFAYTKSGMKAASKARKNKKLKTFKKAKK